MRIVPSIVAFLFLSPIVICPASAQLNSQGNPGLSAVQAARRRASPASPASPPQYQRGDTWYEFLLRQFNPGDFDYGTWMEQRRQAFLDASVRNRYFRYGAMVTFLLLVLSLLYTKQRIDHHRSMWITAEMMTDLYNHDAYSREVARHAIQKYNEHLDRCNRAVEASEDGVSTAGMESEVERYRAELQAVTAERDGYKRERDLAKSDLTEKERMLADMSLRLDTLAKKSAGGRDASGAVDLRIADQKLVQHINNLQEQLCAEKRENRRLKGA